MKLDAAARHAELYPDRHLNVFVPYRAHDLDYNVTRAVVSTLRWARPDLAREFAAELCGVEAAAAGPLGYQFDLHACDYEDFDPAKVRHQVVLGVSVEGRIAEGLPSLDALDRDAVFAVLHAATPAEAKLAELRRLLARPELTLDEADTLAHTLEELEQGSLPDGWVFSPEASVCVLIEAKLQRLLDRTQLARYAEVYFEKGLAPEHLVLRTWADVARFFAARRGDLDPLTAFLCRQLHDYLDVLGLAGFGGFKPYDFDPDAAHEALPKFLAFAHAARAAAVEAGVPLGEVRPSPTGARIAWADEDLPGELRLDLLEAGLRIEHRAGDAPAGRHAGRRAVDAILARPEDENPLAGLSDADAGGLRLRVERLTASAPGGEAFPDLVVLDEALAPAEFGLALEELRRQHPPAERARDLAGHTRQGALSIGRLVARDDLLGAAEAATAPVVAACHDLLRVARALAPRAAAGA